MSRKTDLVNILQEYKNRYESVWSKVTEIKRSIEYTEAGREQAINRVLGEFAPFVQTCHDKAVQIVDNGLNALLEKWKKNTTGKINDGGYQAGLANVIKMLELGVLTEKDDIQNIIDTYVDDFNALAAIKAILVKSEDERSKDCVAMIPADTRENNKRLLSQLRGNIDSVINVYADGSGVLLSLDGMLQFITDRLADNLELLN